MPEDAYAVIRSEALPVSVVTVLALTVPEVWPSRVLRTETARVVSERVTASLPRLLMPLEAYAVLRSEALPVRVVTLLASMVPEVLPSRVLRTETARVVSERVAASLPRPVMLEPLAA